MQPFDIGWTTAFTGAAVGFGCLLLLYAVGFMGAGDVKFAGALGLWVGLPALLPIWVVGSLLAGLHSTLFLALQHWPVFPRLSLMLQGRIVRRSSGEGAEAQAPPRRSLRCLSRTGHSGVDGLGATELADTCLCHRRPFILPFP
jgi:prepilin peptidase CpaA